MPTERNQRQNKLNLKRSLIGIYFNFKNLKLFLAIGKDISSNEIANIV